MKKNLLSSDILDQSFNQYNNVSFDNKNQDIVSNYSYIFHSKNMTSNIFSLNNFCSDNSFDFLRLSKTESLFNNSDKENQVKLSNDINSQRISNEQQEKKDVKIAYGDYFLKASANVSDFKMINNNDIINNIFQGTNEDITLLNDKEKNKSMKNNENIIVKKYNNKVVDKNNDDEIDYTYLYGHPNRVKYKTIKQKLNIHKKIDKECREDTFLLLHSLKRLKLLLEKIKKNGKIKNRKNVKKLKIFFNKSILSLDHKLYAQDILGKKIF